MKVLVVDDESLARERLLRLLAKLRPDTQCLEAADGEEALEQVKAHAPDLVLLDIHMPGKDGLEVAAQFDALDSPPAVIFCTAYDEYALEALRHQAVAYLLKPVRSGELAQALDNAGRVNRVQLASLRVEQAVSQGTGDVRTQVSSETHRGLETMPVDEVRCFLAEQKYVTAYSSQGQLLIPDTLKDLQQEFGESFVRVHRNALVALAHIVRLHRDERIGWCVELEGVEERPIVSRRHLSEVKKRLERS